MPQCTLISLVGFSEIIGHDIAMGEHSPCFAAGVVLSDSALEIGNRLRVAFFLCEYGARLGHGANICRIDGKDTLESLEGTLAIIHSALQDADSKPYPLLGGCKTAGQIWLDLKRICCRIVGHTEGFG